MEADSQQDALAEGCMGSQARALWYVGPRAARLDSEIVPPPAPDQVLVTTLWSGVSRGTERLVFTGLSDPGHRDRMRAPMQAGDFPFPVKYGYCAVGRVDEGPPRFLGRHVFALHPHQERFVVRQDAVALVPDSVPPRRATLAASMETALNALWDSGASAGDRIVVIGAGQIGLLITFLAAQLPGAEVTTVDTNAARGAPVAAFGARFSTRVDALHDADVVFHTSATSAGLGDALACCGPEATLVEVSWYGDETVTVGLGGPFHSKRLRLISSQVGAVPAQRQPRWTRRRRLAKALHLLADPRLDALITEEVAFAGLPDALGRILCGEGGGIATVVRYS